MKVAGDSFAEIKLSGEGSSFSGARFETIVPLSSIIRPQVPIDFETGKLLPVTAVKNSLDELNIRLTNDQPRPSLKKS